MTTEHMRQYIKLLESIDDLPDFDQIDKEKRERYIIRRPPGVFRYLVHWGKYGRRWSFYFTIPVENDPKISRVSVHYNIEDQLLYDRNLGRNNLTFTDHIDELYVTIPKTEIRFYETNDYKDAIGAVLSAIVNSPTPITDVRILATSHDSDDADRRMVLDIHSRDFKAQWATLLKPLVPILTQGDKQIADLKARAQSQAVPK